MSRKSKDWGVTVYHDGRYYAFPLRTFDPEVIEIYGEESFAYLDCNIVDNIVFELDGKRISKPLKCQGLMTTMENLADSMNAAALRGESQADSSISESLPGSSKKRGRPSKSSDCSSNKKTQLKAEDLTGSKRIFADDDRDKNFKLILSGEKNLFSDDLVAYNELTRRELANAKDITECLVKLAVITTHGCAFKTKIMPFLYGWPDDPKIDEKAYRNDVIDFDTANLYYKVVSEFLGEGYTKGENGLAKFIKESLATIKVKLTRSKYKDILLDAQSLPAIFFTEVKQKSNLDPYEREVKFNRIMYGKACKFLLLEAEEEPERKGAPSASLDHDYCLVAATNEQDEEESSGDEEDDDLAREKYLMDSAELRKVELLEAKVKERFLKRNYRHY